MLQAMMKSALQIIGCSNPRICLRFSYQNNVASDIASSCNLEWKLPCKKGSVKQGFFFLLMDIGSALFFSQFNMPVNIN